MFSRDFRRPKRVKFKIYLSFEGAGDRLLWLVLLSCRVPCLLSAFLLCFTALPFKYALFSVLGAFLAGFGVRMYICMGLGFCVDCGAFVCVSG